MATAAREGDFERLQQLRHAVAALRAPLAGRPDDHDETPESLPERAVLVHRILDDDAEIRRHTEPHMEDLGRWLIAGGKRRRSVGR